MNQVKTKDRVRDHGEVFTAEREVNAMLGLVQHETERIDSRFLEPACGTGNFLAPVLERKIALVKKKYGRSQVEFERYAVLAVGSIYGVDLLPDNVKTCQERLFKIFDDTYTSLYKKKCKEDLRESVHFVLNRNILCGDALTLKTNKGAPILFSQWSLATGSKIKRHDYTFEELIPVHTAKGSLFFDPSFKSDTNEAAFIPKPIKEHPLTHVLHLAYENNN